MKKVLVITEYEVGQGSTIVGVVPATQKGRKVANHLKAAQEAKPGFTSVDRVAITEVVIQTAVKGPKIPHGSPGAPWCGNEACETCLPSKPPPSKPPQCICDVQEGAKVCPVHAQCLDCGHAKHGVYCMDTSNPVHCRCKAGMKKP